MILHLPSLSMNHLNHLTDWHKTLTWAWTASRKSEWSLKTWSNASSIIQQEFISSYVNKGWCIATHTRCWHCLDHALYMLSYIQPIKAVITSCQDRWKWTSFFSLIFLFFLFSFLFFYFLFLEQLGLGLEVICHTVTSVTIWWCGHNIDHKTWKNRVEGFRTNDIMQHG